MPEKDRDSDDSPQPLQQENVSRADFDGSANAGQEENQDADTSNLSEPDPHAGPELGTAGPN